MKNILHYLACFLLIIGCSTTNDDGTNSTTTVVPLPPTNLSGTNVASMQVSLTWTDNSTNETGFIIERKTASTNYTIVGNTSVNITKYTDTGLVNNTPYTYRVYSTNSVGNSLTYSNEFKITPFGVPVLTTSPVTSITAISAISGGNITDNGGFNVGNRGVVWNTSPNPTISLSTKTIENAGSGIFTTNLTSLTPGTTYYIRAYANNIKGTGYGNEITLTTKIFPTDCDNDGNTYPYIKIGTQTWMKNNLNVCKYRNGDDIPQVNNPIQWANLTSGAWCYYEYNTENGKVYSKLYNWYAVNDPRGLAPEGWHVASDAEWTILTNFLGGDKVAGDKMKESGTTHWLAPPNNSSQPSNSSGFTALPGGYFVYDNDSFDQPFREMGGSGYWWSSTEVGIQKTIMCRFLVYNKSSVLRLDFFKERGLSVRCIKD